MPRTLLIAASALALGTTGCMTTGMHSQGDSRGGTAILMDARGQQVAVAEVTQEDGELYVSLEVTGLAPGRYAAHIHAVGRCDAPGFESAGPHWNPTNARHGLFADHGAHLGDLPNVAVTAQRRGMTAFQIQNASLRAGPNALLDADGAAMVIHAGEDDYQTDPSGSSGARIACGVLQMGG